MKYSLVVSAIAGLAAAGSAPESSRAAAVHAASPCESVREDCIQASLSEGNSPNFAECAASSASCLQSAAPTATEEAAVWTTTVVTAYTTYCPSATSVVQGNKTYTATASETLTITDCPCTISTPVAAAPMWTPAPSVQPMPASNGTQGPFVPVGIAPAPGAPRGSGAPVVPGAPGTTVPYTGAAGYLAPSVGIVALIFGAAMLF